VMSLTPEEIEAMKTATYFENDYWGKDEDR
jgi:hypothetical protein